MKKGYLSFCVCFLKGELSDSMQAKNVIKRIHFLTGYFQDFPYSFYFYSLTFFFVASPYLGALAAINYKYY